VYIWEREKKNVSTYKQKKKKKKVFIDNVTTHTSNMQKAGSVININSGCPNSK
jgi:hypothetical protein